jgi:hypothetical protein
MPVAAYKQLFPTDCDLYCGNGQKWLILSSWANCFLSEDGCVLGLPVVLHLYWHAGTFPLCCGETGTFGFSISIWNKFSWDCIGLQSLSGWGFLKNADAILLPAKDGKSEWKLGFGGSHSHQWMHQRTEDRHNSQALAFQLDLGFSLVNVTQIQIRSLTCTCSPLLPAFHS